MPDALIGCELLNRGELLRGCWISVIMMSRLATLDPYGLSLSTCNRLGAQLILKTYLPSLISYDDLVRQVFQRLSSIAGRSHCRGMCCCTVQLHVHRGMPSWLHKFHYIAHASISSPESDRHGRLASNYRWFSFTEQ